MHRRMFLHSLNARDLNLFYSNIENINASIERFSYVNLSSLIVSYNGMCIADTSIPSWRFSFLRNT